MKTLIVSVEIRVDDAVSDERLLAFVEAKMRAPLPPAEELAGDYGVYKSLLQRPASA